MDKLQTKHFKIKFSVKIILLCVAVLAVCAAGIALSIVRICNYGIHGFNDVIKYPFLIAVSLACVVIVVALLIRSEYTVDDKDFTVKFGFIKTKYPIKDVTKVFLDREKNKLTVYMGEQYAVLSVDQKWNDEIVRELMSRNQNIEYSFSVTEDKPQE